ncbi:MAG TPA: hypothetical protein VNT51_02785 [Miltoncostaeaceae bacterium]|nr:hypothetical protein [Miltoncostaeaceae bacterium]
MPLRTLTLVAATCLLPGAALAAGGGIDQRVVPAPAGVPGVTVDAGALYTSTPQVQLTLIAPQPHNVAAVRISNDGGFGTSTLVPLADPASSASIPWTLASTGPERLPKTVYVRFVSQVALDGLGTVMGVDDVQYTDDIILDQTAPVILAARMAPPSGAGALARRGPRARPVSVILRARDNLSGVADVQVARSRTASTPWRAYRTRVAATPGARGSVFVRVRDAAGNVSAWREVRTASRSARP